MFKIGGITLKTCARFSREIYAKKSDLKFNVTKKDSPYTCNFYAVAPH